MEQRMFGALWPVSSLTLGGGGLGRVWGATSRAESVATVRHAIDSGITLLDVAPGYGEGEAEEVVGEALAGSLPDGVRVCTKGHVGQADPNEVETIIVSSLEESLGRLRLDFVDLFILHSQILPTPDPEREAWTTNLQLFEDVTRPALEALVDGGRVGAWGITAIQYPELLEGVMTDDPAPRAAQMITNVIDAPGDMEWTGEWAPPRDLIGRADELEIGVMGIRAVQAGALTDRLDRDVDPDHPAAKDYEGAAPFREVAAQLGESAASLAHRYALSMDGVDTVVLGVKNRAELRECLDAADAGPLTGEVRALVDERVAPIRHTTSDRFP
jgi:aryl-alcohol dehydrogenase-like predicted oxidoreductase